MLDLDRILSDADLSLSQHTLYIGPDTVYNDSQLSVNSRYCTLREDLKLDLIRLYNQYSEFHVLLSTVGSVSRNESKKKMNFDSKCADCKRILRGA